MLYSKHKLKQMKKIIYAILPLMFVFAISKAQTTAIDFAGNDCNGNYHHLFADLDSGKMVLLHFFMPNCTACPPPAQKIQAMANHILATHPGMIKAYAMPFNNSTTCSYASSWVSNNGLSLYAPFDSGAAQVAHYGGFGMPTVVLLGGSNHRVLFSTLGFSASDTTIMRDSILALLNSTTGISNLSGNVESFSVFPNPATDFVSVNLELKETANLSVDVTDLFGRKVALILSEIKSMGLIQKQFDTSTLANGNYLVRLTVNGKITTQKLSVIH